MNPMPMTDRSPGSTLRERSQTIGPSTTAPSSPPVEITSDRPIDRPIAPPIRAANLIESRALPATPLPPLATPEPQAAGPVKALVQALLTPERSATARSLSQAEATAVSQTTQLGQFTKQVLAVQPYLQAWRSASQNSPNGAIPSFGFVDYQHQVIVLIQEDGPSAAASQSTQALAPTISGPGS
jgi:hypothetical protein